MPTIIKYRTWCSKCGEWVLHSSPFESNKWVCDRCGSTHEPYYLKDVPTEKLEEQRKRYTDSKIKNIMNVFSKLSSNSNYYASLEIVESDAGQKEIDDLQKEKWKQYRKEKEELKKLYNEKYKDTNRNDDCPCGKVDSNGRPLKYKKCCLKKFNCI